MRKMIFYPNDGRPGMFVNSISDIKNYMGDIISSFSPIEIVNEHVIAYIGGQPIKIGRIEYTF